MRIGYYLSRQAVAQERRCKYDTSSLYKCSASVAAWIRARTTIINVVVLWCQAHTRITRVRIFVRFALRTRIPNSSRHRIVYLTPRLYILAVPSVTTRLSKYCTNYCDISYMVKTAWVNWTFNCCINIDRIVIKLLRSWLSHVVNDIWVWQLDHWMLHFWPTCTVPNATISRKKLCLNCHVLVSDSRICRSTYRFMKSGILSQEKRDALVIALRPVLNGPLFLSYSNVSAIRLALAPQYRDKIVDLGYYRLTMCFLSICRWHWIKG